VSDALPPGNKNLAKRHDWDALRYEWARGTESLEAFRRRKGLASVRFSQVVNEQNWRALREDLRAKAIKKIEPKIIDEIAQRYAFNNKQWLTIEGLLARLIKKLVTTTNAADISPEAIESITRSLERSLKARKLIHGEATGDTPAAGAQSPGVMTHQQVVQLLQAINSKDPKFVIPEAVIDAEIVGENDDSPGNQGE
jgi:hypothetical protein